MTKSRGKHRESFFRTSSSIVENNSEIVAILAFVQARQIRSIFLKIWSVIFIMSKQLLVIWEIRVVGNRFLRRGFGFVKTVNDFLNSEQKIIYTEKRVNNFLNNVEQKIILCKMLEIVYVENNEQFLWENNDQFYLM